MKENPAIQPARIRSFEEMLAEQKRQAIIHYRYRREVKGLTEKELRAAAPNLSRKERAQLLDEVHAIYENDRKE